MNINYFPWVGFDLDGVFHENIGSIIRASKRKFGIDIHREQITKYDLAAVSDLTPEMVKELFDDPATYDGRPNELASFASRIISKFYDIHIVSSRPLRLWDSTLSWLCREKISFVFLKFLPAPEKSRYARICNLKFFVEDNLETAIALSPVVETVYLFDALYNRGETPGNVVRVSGFGELLDRLNLPIERLKQTVKRD